MQRIKIGILDEEKEYVTNLTAYLQRYGKGKWDVAAFTNKSTLSAYLEKRTLDILAGTNRKELIQIGRGKSFIRLWLADKPVNESEDDKNTQVIYRFQSAEAIGKSLDGIVRLKSIWNQTKKLVAAVYSPVGRCGKTTLALEVVRSGLYGKWLYFGMEDYSSFKGQPGNAADEILYYWKERQSDKLLKRLEETENVIATGSSLFDARQISMEDMKWFKEQLEKSDYRGVVFDIGTGVLQNFQIFTQFDYLLVPYIEEEYARIKKANFESLFDVYALEDYKERIHFLNMDKMSEARMIIQRLFGGGIE